MVVSKREETSRDRIVRALQERKMLLPVAFLITFLIDAAILYGIIHAPQNFCLGIVGIGALTPFILIWFRIENPKKLFILVTAVFLIIGPVFAVMYTEYIYSEEPVLYSSDGIMKEGRVSPYTANGDSTNFNFSVLISSEYLNISEYNSTVYLNITDSEGNKFHYNMSESENGTYVRYQKALNLDEGIYTFFFNIEKKNSTAIVWKYTDMYHGALNVVLNVDKGDFIIRSIPSMYLATFMYFAFLSYIIIGMYWWTRIAKEKKRRMVTVKKDEDGGGLKCPVCGNRINEGTVTCPYCGAELEYEDDEESGHSDEDEERVDEDESEE